MFDIAIRFAANPAAFREPAFSALAQTYRAA